MIAWVSHHAPVLVVLLPLAAALVIPIVALRRPSVAHLIATVFALATAAVSVIALITVVRDGPIHYFVGGWTAVPTGPPSDLTEVVFGIELVIDRVSGFFASVVATMAASTLAWSRLPVGHELPGREGAFYSVACLVLVGLMGMLVTADIFNFYVFLEVSSLSGYALVAAKGGRAAAAAFRYLILGTVGASLYLLGVGYLYVSTGVLNMGLLSEVLHQGSMSPVAIAFIVIGLAVKIGLFPFHSWLPDAYADSAVASGGFLAPIMTKVMVYGLLRFLYTILGDGDFTDGDGALGPAALGPILTWAGAIAVIAGSVVACIRNDFRRLLAWSSIAQLGYIVLGIGLDHPLALAGAILHVMNHALMKGALFYVAGAQLVAGGGRSIDDLRGLGGRLPATTTCLVIAGMSMIGVPPLGGFFSKWYLLRGALEQGRYGIAVVLLVGSVLAAIYVFRIIERACFGCRDDEATDEPPSMLLPLGLVTLGVIAGGLLSKTVVEVVLWRPVP